MAALARQPVPVPLMELKPMPTRVLLDGLVKDLLGRFWAKRHTPSSCQFSVAPRHVKTFLPRPVSPNPIMSNQRPVPVMSCPVSQVPVLKPHHAKPTPALCPISPAKVSAERNPLQKSNCESTSIDSLLDNILKAWSGTPDYKERKQQSWATQTEPIQDKKTNKSHSTQTPKGIGTLVNSVQVKHVRSWGTQTIPMHCFPVHYVCTSK